MALKFLNKKGWHTGSLRNVEAVWKAEQKHDAEKRKVEELRKQIQEEREKSEFRLLQEAAGLAPRQERLDFLYDAKLPAANNSSEVFQTLQPAAAAASASSSKAAVPGALFEDDKPQSANDNWRKLHSDPLLLIKQREQEAHARIKNNPIKMAEIKKSLEAEKNKKQYKEEKRKKKHEKKHHHTKSKSKHSSSNNSDSEERSHQGDDGRRKRGHPSDSRNAGADDEDRKRKRHSSPEQNYSNNRAAKSLSEVYTDRRDRRSDDRRKSDRLTSEYPHSELTSEDKGRQESQQSRNNGPGNNRRRGVHHMSEEEREARLRQMQMDAELHEEQRWKRLKKAADADAADDQEAMKANSYRGKNFLVDAQKSIYGAEKGGSSTIEESVRRRSYYSQGGVDAHERNAFRR